MKRLTTALALMALVGGLVQAPAQAAPGEHSWQTVNGSILLPTRFTDANGGWPGLVRRVYNASAASNGLIGYVFDVQPETWGGRFDLKINSQSGQGDPNLIGDLGIYFYSEMGDAGGQKTPVTVGQYEKRGPGGEIGFVPPDARYGIVFMSRGLNVAFTYEAFTPMSVDITDTGFTPADVTVGVGGWVRWTNVGQEFHSVTHSATKPAFDSSPKTNQPLIPGATFSVQFDKVGDYAYYDRYGTATGIVHVVEGPGAGPPA